MYEGTSKSSQDSGIKISIYFGCIINGIHSQFSFNANFLWFVKSPCVLLVTEKSYFPAILWKKKIGEKSGPSTERDEYLWRSVICLSVWHCSGVNWTKVNPEKLEQPESIWKQILHRWRGKREVSSDHLILIKRLSILWTWKRKG